MSKDFLEPLDDGLPVREAGDWTKDKLYYLQRYVDIFIKAMYKKPFRAFNYIDLFAGPGKSILRSTGEIILGSPIIALKQEPPFSNYFFIELDKSYYTALERRVAKSALLDQITIFKGDSNKLVEKVVEEIETIDAAFMEGRWSSLNLSFIDPEDLEAKWDTVSKLTNLYSMDLVIHYPVMALNRYMPIAYESEETTRVDEFFGDDEWKEIFHDFASRGKVQGAHRELIDHYRSKLQNAGYQDVKVGEKEPLMRTDKTNAPLYRLIFASKHSRGHEFWEKISRIDPSGQLSF